ncbi:MULTISPECIES: AAA family ATPase [unclassified Arthrobacter]|uniref:AAA family ATPase n=1 Tax=unclassified Arthrobacter TaxID=235627 RepID=UPI00159CFA15|nr:MULTISPECIES: AAA family ATPase [unclassified Arthrobacter]MCQ9165375.1 AAA family ATPase [Arthrobacter sp. STN4]NVM99608.1 kinase [Arthrobacter sp. SDTb3-6]
MSTLIVLRGNSGSGKSTVARALQHELGAVWIEQDYFRRGILGETGNYSLLSVELIEHAAQLALRHGRDVIMDGMFNASAYSATFIRLRNGHAGPSLFYAWDLTLEETLRRHQTRPHKLADFGEKQMRGWYHGWNALEGVAERPILAGDSVADAVRRIVADVRAAQHP